MLAVTAVLGKAIGEGQRTPGEHFAAQSLRPSAHRPVDRSDVTAPRMEQFDGLMAELGAE